MPEKGNGSILQVQKIFPTLQGEGPLAGHPSVFIRLGGCNLACDFCDTEFEDFTPWPIENIVAEATRLRNHPIIHLFDHPQLAHLDPRIFGTSDYLVVLTGGEPFRQPVGPLCDALLKEGFRIQIETNGTLYRPIDPQVQIVCSPKASQNGYTRLREDLLARLNALKFIVSAQHSAYQTVGNVGQDDYAIPVYIQPMDEYDEAKNAANLSYAQQLAREHGYHLSLQLHKMLGIE